MASVAAIKSFLLREVLPKQAFLPREVLLDKQTHEPIKWTDRAIAEYLLCLLGDGPEVLHANLEERLRLWYKASIEAPQSELGPVFRKYENNVRAALLSGPLKDLEIDLDIS